MPSSVQILMPVQGTGTTFILVADCFAGSMTNNVEVMARTFFNLNIPGRSL